VRHDDEPSTGLRDARHVLDPKHRPRSRETTLAELAREKLDARERIGRVERNLENAKTVLEER
jgi:hypothetical protein